MKLHAELVFVRRVVGLRNVERVEVLIRSRAIAALHDAARHIARVGAALLQASERLVESDSARDDLSGGGTCFLRRTSVKEIREGGPPLGRLVVQPG